MTSSENLEQFGVGLLKTFTLRQLNGYKTITLRSEQKVKIVAGENGAGKTSLLNAIYAVLSGKESVLYKIDFESLDLEWIDGEVFLPQKMIYLKN